MSDQIVEVSSYTDLLAMTDRHPVVEFFLHPTRFHRAWALREGPAATVVWTAETRRRGEAIAGIGVPADVASLLNAVRETGAGADAAHLSVPAGTVPLLSFPVGDGNDWDWFWTTTTPSPRPGESEIVHLDITDPAVLAEVVDLLDVGAPGASTRPDAAHPRAVTWWGIRVHVDGADVLVACAARGMHDPGVTHLSSITTHPDFRGRGLGSDLTAAITRQDLDGGARAVTLGMYADNDVARRVYEKLGFTVGQAFSSRSLT